MKKINVLYMVGVFAAVNALAWIMLYRPTTNNPRAGYPYLSARIFADNPNDTLINFVPLRKQLEAKFDALPEGTQYSFYFEYLPSGTSIRIGDSNELVAASLIKVPLVMNLFRAAELKKIDLEKTVTIAESEVDGSYGDLWQEGAGAKYTLRQLAALALEKSDNTAAHAIYNHTKNLLDEEDQSLAQLDVDQNLANGQAIINAKSYTSILKSLYLASYVGRDSSNEILSFLTKSAEHEKLTKQLPSTVKIAHKNGVYVQATIESDCGIVYVAKRPYALCVMMGLPEKEANTFIASLSKEIYDYVTLSNQSND